MKNDVKQLLRDLRTAVMLGRSEAVNSALDGLLRLPGVSSNDIMTDNFIDQVILPVGEILARLNPDQLRPLCKHTLASGRAGGAAAFAHQFAKRNHLTLKDLVQSASDPRPDVRKALGRTLLALSKTSPEKIYALCESWLKQPASKLRQTALIFLPALAQNQKTRIVELLSPLGIDEDPGVRAGLVDTLVTFSNTGYPEPVLELLTLWSTEPSPNAWVICRTLSSSWAAGYPSEVESILREVQNKTRESSLISNSLKALKRHGLEINL
jgi:hypothetical protein